MELRRIFIGVLLFCLTALPVLAAAAEKPVLRVGMPRISASFIGLDADVGYSGYAYEYIQNVALYGGFECRFVEGTLAECRMRLLNGEIDVLPGEVITPLNQETMSFTTLPMGFTHLDLVFTGGLNEWQTAQTTGKKLRLGVLIGTDLSLYMPNLTDTTTFNAYADMTSAYQFGALDGFIVDNRYHPDSNILMQFAATEMHLAVKKGNEGLLQKLNAAEQEIFIADNQLTARLYEKYYRQNEATPLTLTADETEYLKKKKKIVAVGSPGEWPHTGFKDGRYGGAIADVVKRMAEDLNIELEFVETKTNEESFRMLQEGKAEIITEFFADYNWGKNHNLLLSMPYMTLNYVMVRERGRRISETPTVAVARGHFYPSMFVSKRYSEEQFVYCDTMEECLTAVSEGRADIAFVKSDVARYGLWQGGFYDLVTDGNVEFSHEVSVGISENADPILLRILNKEISHLDPNFIRSVTNQYMLNDGTEGFKLKAIVYNYPMQCMATVAVLALFAVALFGYIALIKRRHAEKIQRLVYEDPWTGRYNWRWFTAEADKLKNTTYKKEFAEGRLGVIVVSLSKREVLVEAFGSEFVIKRIDDITADIEAKEKWVIISAVAGLAGQIILLGIEEEGHPLDKVMNDVVMRISTEKHGSSKRQLNLKAGVYMLKAGDDLKHAINCAEIACSDTYGTATLAKRYDSEMEEQLQLQQKIEDSMEQALASQEFQVWYQPKYDIRTHSTSGAEALVRWQSPTMGFLPPSKFIDIFEANGFVAKLDFYMLENVCRFQRERLDAGLPIVCVSVNQSRVHLMEPGYLQHIQAIKNRYRLPDGAVELELTETAFSIYDQPGKRSLAMAVCRTLQRMGFSMSMDDFGSGYSSIMLLSLLKLDVMKIDKSLLTASGDSMRMEKVLSSVIEMGRKLNMEIICEGIETPEQEELLLRNGCHYGQGYIYSKPIPEKDFAAFLDTKPIAQKISDK